MHILDEIVEKRQKDIKKYGFEFGIKVPSHRARSITPFLAKKGTVLEIKRASPSKGDIAVQLDAAHTAEIYSQAGAAAISVLTENHYFKGNLNDLMAVCSAADSFAARTGKNAPAILRKDFLLYPEEIDVAYKCGADAVLLIARILDDKMLLAMVKKCRELGICALLELRLDNDLRKLALVVKEFGSENIVCGVNSRDLSNFTIDLLTPAGMLNEIRRIAGKNASVIFESGIRTPSAAAFAGSMGFAGMLLGEAAARNPQNASFLVNAFENAEATRGAAQWISFADAVYKKNHSDGIKKPFVKICGITNTEDALNAAELGADFLGFIFCAKSPRNVNAQIVRSTREILAGKSFPLPKIVCVITECDSDEGRAAIELVKDGTADFLQLHGKNAVQQFFSDDTLTSLPHYATVNVSCPADISEIDSLREAGEPRILIDSQVAGKLGGTGRQIDCDLCRMVGEKVKLWLAGGISIDNISTIMQELKPELIDINSGVESAPGKKDIQKLKTFFSQL